MLPALDWGMVSEVVASDSLMIAAMALANRVAVNPPHALRMTKKKRQRGADLPTLLEMSAGSRRSRIKPKTTRKQLTPCSRNGRPSSQASK